MMGGVVISLHYTKLIADGGYKKVWIAFSVLGAAIIALGFFVRPYTDGISKIRATPAWVFICTGIGIILFELFIYLVDVKGKQNWFKIIKPAGTSTLTCYLVPYLMVAIFEMTKFRYPYVLNNGAGGIIRSFAICFIVILITGFLEKKRLRLKI
jgi:predicted acyltransferase